MLFYPVIEKTKMEILFVSEIIFFSSQPNHPYWKSLIDTLFTIDITKLDYKTDKNIDGNVLGTSPMFVFAMWEKYSKIKNVIYFSKSR